MEDENVNGVIDQTALVFEDLFRGVAQILRHQSGYHYETGGHGDEDSEYTKLFI